MQNRNLPNCPVCSLTLGTHGLPATLPCGHNGCMECLRGVQRRGAAQCPVCHCAFGEELPIAPNTELRDLIALATTLFMDEQEREDGWEAFPNKALTAEQYASDLQQERAAAQPPPFSCLSPLLAKGGPSMHPTSQPMPSFYPYAPPGCGDLDREVPSQGAAARRGVPVPGSPSLRAMRHPCSVPSSFAGSSPYGSSPTDARLPHYPGSYSPLESFVPFSRRTVNGSDCRGYCQEELGGEEGGPCTEPRLKSHASNNSLGGAESPQLSSSPASFSSNAMVLAHNGGQGMTAYASGGNGLAPAAAAAAATAAAMRQLMELLPPQWLPDSMATACGGCHKPFRPLVRLRHHCRCCGRIFCQACSSTHVLLPPKFNSREPQRVCDMCASMLASLQPYLASTQTTAAQPPVLDALDSVSLRTWVNAPYCATLEGDVFKAANVLSKFTKAARLQPEAGLPTALLAGAKGLVVMSLIKLGAGWSATYGTGVVVSRASDGAWSAPCSVAAYGLGWGFQVGGELTDLLLVLRTEEAVRAFNGAVHVGVGGNVSVAAGPLGRHADATLMTGTASPPGVPAAAYSYSCSQGAFAGISVEGTLLMVRSSVNRAFYGLPVTANDLLVPPWAMAPPPAAATLYEALADMTRKYENRRFYIYAAPSPSSASSTPIPTLDFAHPPATTITTASPLHTLEGAPLLYHHTTFSKPSPQGVQQHAIDGHHTANHHLDTDSSNAHADVVGLDAVLEGKSGTGHACGGIHKVGDGQPAQTAAAAAEEHSHSHSCGTPVMSSTGHTGKAMVAGTESGVVPVLVPAASVTQLNSSDDAEEGSHQQGDTDTHGRAADAPMADVGVPQQRRGSLLQGDAAAHEMRAAEAQMADAGAPQQRGGFHLQIDDTDTHGRAAEAQKADVGAQKQGNGSSEEEKEAPKEVIKRGASSARGDLAGRERTQQGGAAAETAAGPETVAVGKDSTACTDGSAGESMNTVQAPLHSVVGGSGMAGSSSISCSRSSSLRSSQEPKSAAARAAAAAAAAAARGAAKRASDDGQKSGGAGAAVQMQGRGEGKNGGRQRELAQVGVVGVMEDKERDYPISGPEAESGAQQQQELPTAQARESTVLDATQERSQERNPAGYNSSAGGKESQVVGGSEKEDSAEDARESAEPDTVEGKHAGLNSSASQPAPSAVGSGSGREGCAEGAQHEGLNSNTSQQAPATLGSEDGREESAEGAQGARPPPSLHNNLGMVPLSPEPLALPEAILGMGDCGGGGGGENSATLAASRHASIPSPAGDPMDGWCFDGVAGILEGCFEEEGPAGAGNSSSGMDAGSQIRAQPYTSGGGLEGEIAKAAAAQPGSAPVQGSTQPAYPSTSPSLPFGPPDLDVLDMLLGGEQPSEVTLGHAGLKEFGNFKAARPAAETLVEGGAVSEAVVGSLGSDTSGMEGTMSASSVCGSAPTQRSSPLPGPLVGSAPTGGTVAPPQRRPQVTSKGGGGRKGRKKR